METVEGLSEMNITNQASQRASPPVVPNRKDKCGLSDDILWHRTNNPPSPSGVAQDELAAWW